MLLFAAKSSLILIAALGLTPWRLVVFGLVVPVWILACDPVGVVSGFPLRPTLGTVFPLPSPAGIDLLDVCR